MTLAKNNIGQKLNIHLMTPHCSQNIIRIANMLRTYAQAYVDGSIIEGTFGHFLKGLCFSEDVSGHNNNIFLV